jgi:diaminopimelate decarboxylase
MFFESLNNKNKTICFAQHNHTRLVVQDCSTSIKKKDHFARQSKNQLELRHGLSSPPCSTESSASERTNNFKRNQKFGLWCAHVVKKLKQYLHAAADSQLDLN